MPSEVRHLVDRGQAYPLVRLSGVLDASTAPTVRELLVGLLADQPSALVVDVAGLRADGDVRVLHDVRRETSTWPGARLSLCGVPGDGVWRETGWPSWPDPAAAFAALGPPAPVHRDRLDLEPQPGAARRSRELVSAACGRWGRPDLAVPGCIVVTEMVNNVITHAKTSMVVLLGADADRITVAVRDRSAETPSFDGKPVPVTSYGGRGMLLIDSVASHWGSLVLSDGKVVWAALETAEIGSEAQA